MRTLTHLSEPILYARELSLTAVRTSIYTTLPSQWLFLILSKLPHLETLVLSCFPFVHAAALCATNRLPGGHSELRTLLANDCENSTPAGLCALLPQLPVLRTLDLSGRTGAGDVDVLRAIAALPHLCTLALRDLQLDDGAFGALMAALGTRVHSLDVRNNLLTDAAALRLLDYSFAPPSYAPVEQLEDGVGIAHLRIAGNALSEAGVVALVKSTRLAALDVGAPRGAGGSLVPALSMYAHASLRTLRIAFRVVAARNGLRRRMLPRLKTLVLTLVPEWGSREEAAGLVEFISTTRAAEGDILEVLELEMAAAGDCEDESLGGVLDGDFSFFDSGNSEEGGSSWTGKGEGPMARFEILTEIKKVRDGKDGWEGRVRVLRDLGGMESREIGAEGERWGLVREGV